MTTHRCVGGLKKKLDLLSGLHAIIHFVGFFNEFFPAPTRDHPFYGYFSGIAIKSFTILCFAWGHWWVFNTRNAHNVHIAYSIRFLAIAIPLASALASACKMLGQFLYFLLHFNFTYHTYKAPCNKSLRQQASDHYGTCGLMVYSGNLKSFHFNFFVRNY